MLAFVKHAATEYCIDYYLNLIGKQVYFTHLHIGKII